MRSRDATSPDRTILDAAERRLATVPLRELSVAEITRGAGVSRATFYFYFSSKFAVVAALVARVMDELRAALEPVARGTGDEPREEWIERWVEAAVEVWVRHRPVLRATAENWHAFPELRSLWHGVIDEAAERIRAEILALETPGAPPDPDTRRHAALLAWSIERILCVAGLGADEYLPGERAAVPLITRMLVMAANDARTVCNTYGE
jgi:AcrR family transcriptional regulator